MQSYLPQNAASQMILRDFYVNDLLTGADTVEEAIVVKRDIATTIIGFELRKWTSNDPSVVRNATGESIIMDSQPEKNPHMFDLC